jgi:N-methylhydantoinase A
MKIIRSIDMRYKGQEHTVNVPLSLSLSEFSKEALDVLADSFQTIHEKRYGHSMPDPPEIVHFRVDAVGVMEKPELKTLKKGTVKVSNDAIMGERDVFKGGRVRKYRILNRDKLFAYNVIKGPAIIEEDQATTVLHDKQKLKVGKYGDIIMELEV